MTAELLLGSVSPAVAALARCPVIVVRGSEDIVKARHHRIVLGVGDHATAGAAALFAMREAQTRGCLLEAVRAWRCPANEGVDDPLLAAGPAHEHRERATTLIAEALRDRSPPARESRSSALPVRARPTKCSATGRPRRTFWCWGPKAAQPPRPSSWAEWPTPCSTTPTARWPSSPGTHEGRIIHWKRGGCHDRRR